MELLRHIGILFENDITLSDTILKLRGLFILYILFVVITGYNILSIACSICFCLFCESTNSLKRAAAALFWDLCLYFMKLNNVKINITGDEIDTDSAIVISNHQSLADYIVMAQLAKYSNSGKQGMATIPKKNDRLTLPRINFFSWFLIWSVPKIKILFNLAKCDENWELDKPLTELVFDNLFKSKRPEWIILFPEVNIWTEEASALQRRQSEKFYLPVLHNILYPRFSGFQNVISAINAKYNFKFTKLYDVTLNYYRAPKNSCTLDCLQPVNDRPRCPISLIEAFASNSDITITVNVKTRAVARIPNKRNKLEKWLENVWIDKDKLVTRMIQADREIDNCKQIKTKSIVSPSTEVLFHELTDDLVPGEKGIIISNSQGY